MTETVTLLEVRGHPLIGSGLAIIGTSGRDNGDAYGEGFLLLPNAEPDFRHKIYAYSGTHLPQPEVLALLGSQVRTWLQGELNAHVLAWQTNHSAAPLVPPYSLHEIADRANARLSLLDAIGTKNLVRIKKESRTRELQEYVATVFDIADYFRPLG